MASQSTEEDANIFSIFRKGSKSGEQQKVNLEFKPGATLPLVPEMNAEEYDMTHLKRGVALIFNHVHFSNGPRLGAKADAASLKSVLEDLEFSVVIHEDKTTRGIESILEEVARQDHKDEDCLAVFVMTHGDPGVLYASDGPYQSSKIWQAFTAEKCPTLIGKPKLFFFQACRGSKVDSSVRVTSRTFTQTDGATRISYSIPTTADTLIANATLDGYFAWRSATSGSWFIEALANELKLHGKTKEINHILVRVNRRVAINYSSYVPEDKKKHNKKQMPNFLSTLTRELYFHPKNKYKEY